MSLFPYCHGSQFLELDYAVKSAANPGCGSEDYLRGGIFTRVPAGLRWCRRPHRARPEKQEDNACRAKHWDVNLFS